MARYSDNLEIFFSRLSEQTPDTCFWNEDDKGPVGEGWFYWCCSPGCLPEGDPIGPFATEEEAHEDAIEKGYVNEDTEGR